MKKRMRTCFTRILTDLSIARHIDLIKYGSKLGGNTCNLSVIMRKYSDKGLHFINSGILIILKLYNNSPLHSSILI